MMERNPGCPARDVEQCVQYGPIRHGVGAVFHSLGFTERRRDASGVEMIAADDDRRGYLARRDQIVYRYTESRAGTLSEPADPGRKALIADALRRQLQPAAKMRISRKELQRQLVGSLDVGGVARERHPSERTFALTEKRPHV